jgi:hypothetical protein
MTSMKIYLRLVVCILIAVFIGTDTREVVGVG